MVASSIATNPRLVAAGAWTFSACLARMSNVSRSNLSKNSIRNRRAAETRKMTPKAIKIGMRLTGFSFTALHHTKKIHQAQERQLWKSRATLTLPVAESHPRAMPLDPYKQVTPTEFERITQPVFVTLFRLRERPWSQRTPRIVTGLRP